MGKKLLAQEYYKAPPFDVVLHPEAHTGGWQKLFGRQAPIHVEIGMGLGQHLIEFAKLHPELNHVGLELKMHRIYTARHKALRHGVRHVRFVPGDAIRALEAFAPGEISHLTLLFADPWPNPRDEAKRLTSPAYVALYKHLLAPGGVLHFRHDNPDFFAYSMDTFGQAGFDLDVKVPLDRIETDFERRWLSEGRQIYGFDATSRL